MSEINATQTGNSIISSLTSQYDGALDVTTLVDSMLFAETGIEIQSVERRLTELQTKEAGFTLLGSALNGFTELMGNLGQSFSSVGRTVNLTNDSVASVDVTPDVEEGNYSLEVLSLAQKQAVTSGTFGSSSDLVGSGQLVIETGEWAGSFNGSGAQTSVTINAGDTVQDMVDAINQSGAGVTAYLVQTGTGVQVAMTGKQTGKQNGFSITVNDSDGNNNNAAGLSQFSLNNTSSNMSVSQSASNATALFDGVMVSSETNRMNNVIPGFDITLTSVNAGSPSIVSVVNDVAGAREVLDEFVDSYNSLVEVIDYLGDPEVGEDETQGSLFRDRDLKAIKKQVTDLAAQYVAGYGGDAHLNSLGVRFSDESAFQLEVDDTIFNQALTADPDAVKKAMSLMVTPSSSEISFVEAPDTIDDGVYGDVVITQLARGAIMTGGASSGTFVSGTNDEFSFSVNGESTGTIQLTQQFYGSKADIAQEIQNKVNVALQNSSVSVTWTGSAYEIKNNVKGSVSNITLESAEAGFELLTGFSVGSSESGLDVMGNIDGDVGFGVGNTLEIITGDLVGLKIDVHATATGTYGDVTVSNGILNSFKKMTQGINSSGGYFFEGAKLITDQISEKQERISELETRTEELRIRYNQEFSNLNSYVMSMQQLQEQLRLQFESNSDN